jgi:hypothetical protein
VNNVSNKENYKSDAAGKSDLNLSGLEKLTGFPSEHIDVFIKYAQDKKTVFGFRPISPLVTSLIKEEYPSKGFHIKGKSSNWGPQAGFICCDQSLSKLAGSMDAINKSNNKVSDCIKDGRAIPGPLIISSERLNELCFLGVLTKSVEVDGRIRLYCKSPNEKSYEFLAVRQESDSYKIMHHDYDVEVLYHAKANKPLIPDYDVLLIASHIEDYSSQDTVAPYKKHDPDFGAVSERLQKFTDDIHMLLGRGQNYELIQHCADTHNGATDITANYPAVLFSPNPLQRFESVAIIHSTEELAEYIQLAKNEGFQIPVNKRWKYLQNIARESFVYAKTLLSEKFTAGEVSRLTHKAIQQGVNAEISMTTSRRKSFEKSSLERYVSVSTLTSLTKNFPELARKLSISNQSMNYFLNTGKFQVVPSKIFQNSIEGRKLLAAENRRPLLAAIKLNESIDIKNHCMDVSSYLSKRVPELIVQSIEKNGADIYINSEVSMGEYYQQQGFDSAFEITGPTSTKYHIITSSKSPKTRLIISNINSNARLKHNALQLLYAGADLHKINIVGAVAEGKDVAVTSLKKSLTRFIMTQNDLLYIGSRTPVMKHFSAGGGKIVDHNVGGFVFSSTETEHGGKNFNVFALRMPNGDLAYDAIKTFLEAGLRNVIMCGAGGRISGDAKVGDYIVVDDSTYENQRLIANDIANIIKLPSSGYMNNRSALNITVDSPLEETNIWFSKNIKNGSVDVETAHILRAISERNNDIKLVSGLFVSDVLGEHPLDDKINSGGAQKNIKKFVDETARAFIAHMDSGPVQGFEVERNEKIS